MSSQVRECCDCARYREDLGWHTQEELVLLATLEGSAEICLGAMLGTTDDVHPSLIEIGDTNIADQIDYGHVGTLVLSQDYLTLCLVRKEIEDAQLYIGLQSLPEGQESVDVQLVFGGHDHYHDKTVRLTAAAPLMPLWHFQKQPDGPVVRYVPEVGAAPLTYATRQEMAADLGELWRRIEWRTFTRSNY